MYIYKTQTVEVVGSEGAALAVATADDQHLGGTFLCEYMSFLFINSIYVGTFLCVYIIYHSKNLRLEKALPLF